MSPPITAGRDVRERTAGRVISAEADSLSAASDRNRRACAHRTLSRSDPLGQRHCLGGWFRVELALETIRELFVRPKCARSIALGCSCSVMSRRQLAS